jgi:hypothetical protein
VSTTTRNCTFGDAWLKNCNVQLLDWLLSRLVVSTHKADSKILYPLSYFIFHLQVKRTCGFGHFPISALNEVGSFSTQKSGYETHPGSPSVTTLMHLGQITVCFISFPNPNQPRLVNKFKLTLKMSYEKVMLTFLLKTFAAK